MNFISRILLNQQGSFNLLIFLILTSFGFFGSLSHIFSLALLILTFVSYTKSNQNKEIDYRAKTVFFSLSGCFFLFFITGILRTDFGSVFQSLSSMLSIPIIGMLVIFHKRAGFKLSSKCVSQFSQISIFFALIVYLLLSKLTDTDSIFHIYHGYRLVLFSGNPIPFSFAMLGISIFCLTNWRNSSNKNRLITFLLFLTGIYFAGFLSGSRGTLLAILLITPFILFYLTKSFLMSILIVFVSTLIGFFLTKAGFLNFMENYYFYRITSGLESIFLSKSLDSSAFERLEMWKAAIRAISDSSIFGYGVTERFSALKPFLINSTFQYSHPHNDILAGSIASGIVGGFTALITIMSALLAAIIAPERNTEKVLLGLVLSLVTLTTASVSTVFFNDISSAWLAFSTYLIWATDFKANNPKLENIKK